MFCSIIKYTSANPFCSGLFVDSTLQITENIGKYIYVDIPNGLLQLKSTDFQIITDNTEEIKKFNEKNMQVGINPFEFLITPEKVDELKSQSLFYYSMCHSCDVQGLIIFNKKYKSLVKNNTNVMEVAKHSFIEYKLDHLDEISNDPFIVNYLKNKECIRDLNKIGYEDFPGYEHLYEAIADNFKLLEKKNNIIPTNFSEKIVKFGQYNIDLNFFVGFTNNGDVCIIEYDNYNTFKLKSKITSNIKCVEYYLAINYKFIILSDHSNIEIWDLSTEKLITSVKLENKNITRIYLKANNNNNIINNKVPDNDDDNNKNDVNNSNTNNTKKDNNKNDYIKNKIKKTSDNSEDNEPLTYEESLREQFTAETIDHICDSTSIGLKMLNDIMLVFSYNKILYNIDYDYNNCYIHIYKFTDDNDFYEKTKCVILLKNNEELLELYTGSFDVDFISTINNKISKKIILGNKCGLLNVIEVDNEYKSIIKKYCFYAGEISFLYGLNNDQLLVGCLDGFWRIFHIGNDVYCKRKMLNEFSVDDSSANKLVKL